ncbi:hypothetical protein CBR_g61650 [Chara braunii]|uniref:Uncharacterized protein n=1 Tax=Chara braunii TaxID=69332 RepID=A0A388MFI4_CHABU|nr:hypothetical protein CBR_g61650 [Chara braunii]|eukprot:GBG93245.1 hypothetical protein CBR_g61650 [Chara braunii]
MINPPGGGGTMAQSATSVASIAATRQHLPHIAVACSTCSLLPRISRAGKGRRAVSRVDAVILSLSCNNNHRRGVGHHPAGYVVARQLHESAGCRVACRSWDGGCGTNNRQDNKKTCRSVRGVQSTGMFVGFRRTICCTCRITVDRGPELGDKNGVCDVSGRRRPHQSMGSRAAALLRSSMLGSGSSVRLLGHTTGFCGGSICNRTLRTMSRRRRNGKGEDLCGSSPVRADAKQSARGGGPPSRRRSVALTTTTDSPASKGDGRSPSQWGSIVSMEYAVVGVGGLLCAAGLYALFRGLARSLGGKRGKGQDEEGTPGLGILDMPQAVKERLWRSESMASLNAMASELRAKKVADLNGRNLGDEGVKYLAESLALNRVAARVDLSSNGIGADGFKALAFALSENDFLEHLNVSGNRAADDGAMELAKALEKHRAIQHVDMSSNNIGNDGAIALAEVLKKSTSITTLELNNNEIDYDGFVAIAGALAVNTSLRALHLNGNYAGSLGAAALAKGLAENKSLKELHLNGNSISDEGIRVLVTEGLASHKGKITTIDLGNNSIGSKGAHYIASFLRKSKSLLWLNLYMNDIGDKGAERMGDALKKNKSLTTLDLGGNNIHAQGMGHIAEAFKENKTLTTLELGYNPIGPDGAKVLSDVLKFNGAVETLRLGWCKIGVKGAEHIADALRYNSTIMTLDLRANSLGDDGVVALARTLRVVNETLVTLDLGFNEIRDKGAYSMAEALKANGQAAVSTLNMSSNYITKYGEVALSEARDIVSEMNDGKEVNILW